MKSLVAAVAAFLSLVPRGASGDVVFSNLGAGTTFDLFHAWTINGQLEVGTGKQAIAHQFTPSSTFVFSDSQVALSSIRGTAGVVVSLHSDAGGLPGPVIEQFTISELTPTSSVFTVTSAKHPLLQSGASYWLSVVAGGSGFLGGWSWNSTGDACSATNCATTQDGNPEGPWWPMFAGDTRSAFAINGTRHPPPTSAFRAISNVTSTSARNSNVVLLNRAETLLFVSNQYSDTVTVLGVEPATGKILSIHGIYPTIPTPVGMALSAAGDRLYVAGFGGIAVHAVASDGSLSDIEPWIWEGNGHRGNGIVYLTLPGGDFVYVNEGHDPNLITAYQVQRDGTLLVQAAYATGGSSTGSMFAAQRLIAAGGRLFAANDDSIAVLDVRSDGSLAPVGGSPFALPDGFMSRAGIAVTPDLGSLYAGTAQTMLLRYAIAPDGTLSFEGLQPCSGTTPNGNNGVTVDPAGRYLVVETPGLGADVFEIPSMHRIGTSTVNRGTGTMRVFNAAGTFLFAGIADMQTMAVRSWSFRPASDVPELTCLGRLGAPLTLPTEAGTCRVTIDNVAKAAGGCVATTGGLASCTFDGVESKTYEPGPEQWVDVMGVASTGNLTACTSFIRVADRESPTLSAPVAAPAVLWPPDDRMVDVMVSYSTSDNCPQAIACRLTVTSNEGAERAWEVVDAHRVRLAAQRSGGGAGRVYTIGVTCLDGAGNQSQRDVSVVVPHDMRN